jgi:hypothetical protein
MSSRSPRVLVVIAPDGTEVTERTSGSYTVAGIVQNEDGSWWIAAHGNSWDSVKSRTSMRYGRGSYKQMHVAELRERTAPVLRDYFGTHAVRVISWYHPDKGWTTETRCADATSLRQLHRDGCTAVEIQILGRTHDGKAADFQMTEIIKSLNERKADS